MIRIISRRIISASADEKIERTFVPPLTSKIRNDLMCNVRNEFGGNLYKVFELDDYYDRGWQDLDYQMLIRPIFGN